MGKRQDLPEIITSYEEKKSTKPIKLLIEVFESSIKKKKFNSKEKTLIKEYKSGLDPQVISYLNTKNGIIKLIQELKLNIEIVDLEKKVVFYLDQDNKNSELVELWKAGFIFDPEQVLKNKIFPFLKLNGDLAGFGFLLPRNREKYDRKGDFIGEEQVQEKVLITSDHNLHLIGNPLFKQYKIKFEVIPSHYSLRWNLRSIEKFLEKKTPRIDGMSLFLKIKEQYQKFMYFTLENWYRVHALWDIGTYFFLLFRYYPLFEIRGLSGAGKTKIMTISRQISFNATEEMTNPSEATLFRETHDKRPTKYIDEAEKLFIINRGKVEADPRAELINSGYKYTGTVPRQEKVGKQFRTTYFNTYSPTMVCSINGLYGSTENRAIVHITTKIPKGDKRGDLEPNEEEPIWQEIRNELYLFALQNWKQIEELYNNLDLKEKIRNRALQIWKPLLTIAKFIDEDLFNEMLSFAQAASKIKEIDIIPEGSTQFNLLKVTHELIRLGHNPILIKEISERYPVPEYKPSNRTIAKELDRLGFMDLKDHFEGGNGYTISKDLFEQIVSSISPNLLPRFIYREPSADLTEYAQHTEEIIINPSKDELLKFVRENDFTGNLCKIYEAYPDNLINQSLRHGELVKISPNYIKVIE